VVKHTLVSLKKYIFKKMSAKNNERKNILVYYLFKRKKSNYGNLKNTLFLKTYCLDNFYVHFQMRFYFLTIRVMLKIYSY